jgi:hypothetical protein
VNIDKFRCFTPKERLCFVKWGPLQPVRNSIVFQEASKSQVKQALRMVRNICQPKTGASTGNGTAALFCMLDSHCPKNILM